MDNQQRHPRNPDHYYPRHLILPILHIQIQATENIEMIVIINSKWIEYIYLHDLLIHR